MKASSLMETLVALLIISMIIAITTVIIVNVSGSNTTYKKTQWNALAQSWLEKSIALELIFDDEQVIDNVVLSKEVSNYSGMSELQVLTVSVLEENMVVYEIKRIVAP